MRRRLMGALIVAGTVGGATYGAAAGLGGFLFEPSLGAEDAAVVGCDTDGVSTSFTIGVANNTFVVTEVLVAEMSDRCRGQTLELFLTSGGALIPGTHATATVATGEPDDNRTTVPLPTPPVAKNVNGIHIAIQ